MSEEPQSYRINTDADQMRKYVLAMGEKGVGYCYITDGRAPNPWRSFWGSVRAEGQTANRPSMAIAAGTSADMLQCGYERSRQPGVRGFDIRVGTAVHSREMHQSIETLDDLIELTPL